MPRCMVLTTFWSTGIVASVSSIESKKFIILWHNYVLIVTWAAYWLLIFLKKLWFLNSFNSLMTIICINTIFIIFFNYFFKLLLKYSYLEDSRSKARNFHPLLPIFILNNFNFIHIKFNIYNIFSNISFIFPFDLKNLNN